MVWGSNPSGGQDIFLQIIHINSDPPNLFHQYWKPLPASNREVTVYDSPPSSAEVKDECSYTYIPPIHGPSLHVKGQLAFTFFGYLSAEIMPCSLSVLCVLCRCFVFFVVVLCSLRQLSVEELMWSWRWKIDEFRIP